MPGITIIDYQRKVRELRVTQAAPNVFRALFLGYGGGPMVEVLDQDTDEIRDTEITPYGEMRVIGDATGKTGAPLTTFDATRTTNYVRTAAIAYETTTDELRRMNLNSIPIRQLKAAANYQIAETFLENACLLGSTQYGFGSLLNHGSITPAAAATKAAGGTTWAVATFEEVVTELLNAHWAVRNNSYKRWIGNTIGVPDIQHQRAMTLVHPYTQKNAIATAIERSNGGITRVLPINQLSGLGGGATNRMICYDANPLVVQMSEMSFRELKTVDTDFGFKTIEILRTGGTIWNDTAGCVYIDGI